MVEETTGADFTEAFSSSESVLVSAEVEVFREPRQENPRDHPPPNLCGWPQRRPLGVPRTSWYQYQQERWLGSAEPPYAVSWLWPQGQLRPVGDEQPAKKHEIFKLKYDYKVSLEVDDI